MPGPIVDEVLEKLHQFAEAIIVRRREQEGHIDSFRRWRFERGDNGSITMEEIDPVLRVDWPMRETDTWLSSVPGYAELEALLATVPNIREATQRRVRGPDPEKARKLALQYFIRDYLADVCERDAYRISNERQPIADMHVRRLVVDGLVEHRLRLYLCELNVPETIDLDGLMLRSPSDDELQALFNLRTHDGPFEAAMMCTALIEVSELVRIGEQSVLDTRARGVIRALRVWTGSRVCPVVSTTVF